MTSYFILSFLLALTIVLFFYTLMSSNVKTTDIITSKETNLSKPLDKAIHLFGGDIYSIIPERIKRKNRHNHNMDKLFVTSANPWKITQTEFLILQILLGIGGLIATVLVYLILGNLIPLPAILILGGLVTFLGWYYPLSYYRGRANNRISAFKRDLPEAIDYLRIALSGASMGLPTAIERMLHYLPKDSVMHDEFQQIIDDLNSGKSMSEALDSFAKRAPTESIEAFVKALNSANQNATPLIGILRDRADASRKDLNAEIDRKITTLPTKVMLIFGPIAYISILIIAMAPAAYSLIGML
jgi:Flp pilus assembly protein TadB